MEPELIMEKVAKASGANYNFHKESSKFQDSGPQAPVVSWLHGGFLVPLASQLGSLGPTSPSPCFDVAMEALMIVPRAGSSLQLVAE